MEVLGLLAALACAVRTGSTGTSCCVNQGTNFEAKDLMKMCEFLLSDPHEKSDAERLKNANKCMSRMHLSEMGLPDMKISKQPEDSAGFLEALAAAQTFQHANKTVWTKSYWWSDHKCPEGMELVTDPVVKSWRCDAVGLQLVEVLTSLPVERYATREVLEDVHDEMARAKKVAEDIERSDKEFDDFESKAEKSLDTIAANQAAQKELAKNGIAEAQAEFDKIEAKYGSP